MPVKRGAVNGEPGGFVIVSGQVFNIFQALRLAAGGAVEIELG